MNPGAKLASTDNPQPEITVVSAMAALNGPVQLGATEFEALLKSYPEASKFKNFSQSEGSFTFGDGQAIVGISLVPSPISWIALEIPCKSSWLWPEASESLRNHTQFLFVNLVGPELKIIDAMLKLTCVMAAICSLPQCAGIYWGAAELVLKPGYFARQSKDMSREHLPLYLWVNFFGQRNHDGSSSIFTKGMKSLGFMEIEMLDTHKPSSDLVGFAFNVAHYLLGHGPVLKDGDTIGMSADEKIRIHHRPSSLNKDEIIYQLTTLTIKRNTL